MPRPLLPRPTDAELAILRILWERGPSTVRQVHDLLARERQAAYTTALKLLQIMTEKGLVERDERDRTHVYRARLGEEQTQRQLVRGRLGVVHDPQRARAVEEPEEKRLACREIVEHIVPGRWQDVRPPSENELKATAIVAMPIEEASAKIRTGPPKDFDEDLALPAWTGVIPLDLRRGPPYPETR